MPAITGCSKSDSAVRVWRPSDHDQAPEQSASGQPTIPAALPLASSANKPDSVQSIWDSLCAGCHGHAGDGSGPMGPSIGARDLSDPAWLASTNDDQIANNILHGKGRMPAFSLGHDTIQGLVWLIRGRAAKNQYRSIKP